MFSGQRFLLTHIWLRGFGGAELNILELAQFLKENGAIVEVFTHLFKEPLKQEFERLSIPVIVENDYPFSVSDYDVVIVCQNVLPDAFIDYLDTKQGKNLPQFVFLHMAALPAYVLEQPYIWGLEETISSGTFAISEEVVEKNLSSYFETIPNLQLYQNLVPTEYETDYSTSLQVQTVKKIAVISNHPPQEVLEIEPICVAQGIQVDYYGVWSDKYQRANKALFEPYDCIVAIGKNVPYCLVMGKPIYVYDQFKGPGFLNETNFRLAEKNNFSGRGFEENGKTAEEIVTDLRTNFADAQRFQLEQIHLFREQFLLKNRFPILLETVKRYEKQFPIVSDTYIQYVRSMSRLIRETVVRLEHDVENLWAGIHTIEEQKKDIENQLAEQRQENVALQHELQLIQCSGSYRLVMWLQKIKKKLFR